MCYIGVVYSILYGVYSKGYKSFILFAIGTLVQFRSVASSLDKLDMDIRHFHSTVSNMFRDFISNYFQGLHFFRFFQFYLLQFILITNDFLSSRDFAYFPPTYSMQSKIVILMFAIY